MSCNRDLMELIIGQNGFDFISDTVQHVPTSGYYGKITIVANATFTEATCEPAIGGNTFTGVVIPAGTIIYGRFKSLTLTSGSVIAHKSV